jgi:hypothetical protein
MRMPTAIFNLVSVWVNDYTPPTTGREIEKSRPLLAGMAAADGPTNRVSQTPERNMTLASTA